MELKQRVQKTKQNLNTSWKWILFGTEWSLLLMAFFISLFDTVFNKLGNWLMKGAEKLNRKRNNVEMVKDLSERSGFELLISAVSIVWPGLARSKGAADVVDFPPRKGNPSVILTQDELQALGVKGSSGESDNFPVEEPSTNAS